MPGTLYHLVFAEEVYKRLVPIQKMDKISFMCGNLIPDLATDKEHSHYRKNASVEGFFVPEIEAVKKDLFCLNNPIYFGMYTHLYLDHYFIEEFLLRQFIWDLKNRMVINPRNHKKWDAKTFFSNDGMYGAYTSINHLILKDGLISKDLLDQIPAILPPTGIPLFDTRRPKTWKQELEEYFAQKKEYTGDIFDYSILCEHIQKIANQLIEEILVS